MQYFKTFENFTNHKWYHGSKYEFQEFILKKGTFLDPNYISPIFLTSDLSFAKAYAGYNTPHVYEVKVLTDNIFDFRTLPTGSDLMYYIEDDIKKSEGIDYELGRKLFFDIEEGKLKGFEPELVDREYNNIICGDYSVIEHVGFYEWLKENNYDGAYVTETKTLNLFIFDPRKLIIIDEII